MTGKQKKDMIIGIGGGLVDSCGDAADHVSSGHGGPSSVTY